LTPRFTGTAEGAAAAAGAAADLAAALLVRCRQGKGGERLLPADHMLAHLLGYLLVFRFLLWLLIVFFIRAERERETRESGESRMRLI
jgi:hypothetical protein